MKKKKLEKKLRRLEKRLWIAEINKIPGIKYFAAKEAIAEYETRSGSYRYVRGARMDSVADLGV